MTPKDYQIIAQEVYNADSKSKEKISKGDRFVTTNKYWEVIKVEDNQENGFQAMAVAPIKNGTSETDTSQIVVAFAGTNTSDVEDLRADAINIGMSLPGHQLSSANKFSEEVKKEYPNAYISTTGHSLGAFLSLAQGAENHLPAVTFNGPDPYNVLTKQAKKWTKQNPGMLTNFLNQYDVVGSTGNIIGVNKIPKLLGNKPEAVGIKIALKLFGIDDPDVTGAATIIKYNDNSNLLNNHMIETWKFNEDGNILDGRGTIYGLSFKIQLLTLSNLRKRLTSNSGGLSSGEKIYLDSAQALAIVSTAAADFDTSMQNLLTIYREGIQQQEKLWEDTIFAARRSGDMLDDLDIYEALESTGFTYDNIVEFPCLQYRQKITKIERMSEEFKSLEKQIKTKIEEIIARDSELAQQIRG